MDYIFSAVIKNGKMVLKERIRFIQHLSSLEEKAVDVIVRKHKKKRSNQQNKYYWAAVVGIPAKHYGYLPEEMHDAFKMIFLRCHEEGKPETVKSTSSLSTVEFSEYVEKCQQWCAEQGLLIPDPEQLFLEQN